MFTKIVAHTSFLGHTGYNNHSREFFTSLNNKIPVKIRNFTYTDDISYLTQSQLNMLITQKLNKRKIGSPLELKKGEIPVNIILNETDHYYFYHDYPLYPTIAYNVWESTRQPDHFFKRLLDFDQLWVPTQWQKNCSIEQGYPENRVKIVPEAIDPEIFKPGKPLKKLSEYDGRFKFLLFGRWDYRKSTTEIIKTFLKTFNKNEPVDLICSIDNPFSNDNLNTLQRLEKYGLNDERIKIKHFVPFDEYLSYLKSGHVFVSCARSEGWNLPLCEAIACGIPTISSNFGAQLEFAENISHLVNINGMEKAKLFQHDENTPGEFSSPDFEHLSYKMRDIYENYSIYKKEALNKSKDFRKKWTWKNASNMAYDHLKDLYSNSKQISNLNPTLTTECGENQLSIKKSSDGLYVFIDGDNKIHYDVCYQDFNDEEYLFKTTIQNNQYTKLFEDSINLHKNIYVFITSENGDMFDFLYNSEENTIKELNKNQIDKEKLNPPVIITGSVGGGTSYITKFLRYCGLFTGKDNCNIQERKTHESKTFKSINEFLKIGKFDKALDKNKINYIKNQIDTKKYDYKEIFEKMFLHRSNIFFDNNTDLPWGWKSPLLGLTLPIWYEIFPNAKILSIQKNRQNKQETSKTSTGNWFYNEGDEYSIDAYQNPDIKEQYCPEDIKEIERVYKDYVNNFSSSDMAISLNTSLYLLWTLKKLNPETILERGSGFSTFIFGYYKKYYNEKVKIVSSDTHNEWIEKTKEFISKNNLEHPDYYHIDSVPDEKYDFVFEDTKKEKRINEIDKVLNYIKKKKGYIFFDDFNAHRYVENKAKKKGMYFCSLKKYTFDIHGRYGCIVGRKNFDPHPTENVFYIDFDKFTSDFYYCNRVLTFCGLKPFKSKKSFIQKLKETKYESELPNEEENEDIIIVNSYTETELKQDYLYKCISQLKKTGKEILLTTHYPVPDKVQNLVDYYIYDKRNPLLEQGIYFHHENSDFFYRNNKFGLSTKAYANLLGAQNGIEFAAHKLNKKFFWYLEYDSFIHDADIQKFIDLKNEIYSKNKVGFVHKVKQIQYVEYADQFRPEDSYSNIFFCFDMDFFINTFTFPKDKIHYKEISGDCIGTEWYLYDNLSSFENKFITDESYTTLPLIFKNSVFGSCPDGVHEKHYIDIVPEKDTNDPILFFVVTDFNSGTYIIEKTDINNEIEKIEIPLEHNLHWYLKIKDIKHVNVYFEDNKVYSGDVEYEIENSSGLFFLKDDTIKFIVNFLNGPFIEIKGQDKLEYTVEFIDTDKSEKVYSDVISNNMWTKSNTEYFKNWKINVFKENDLIYEHQMDLKDKKVLISFESKSLGDTIAWIPYVDIFRQKHQCNVYVSTFWNHILDKAYKKLTFITPGTKINDIYAKYDLGCFDNSNKNPFKWQGIPLQKIATDILGLEYKEVKPKINKYKNNINIKKPYICLNEHSTLQAKYWNYPNSWQETVDHYKDKGYEVVVVSKEETNLDNIINHTNNSIENAISIIEGCEFVITVASGIAWIAKALDIPSVIIMGPFNITEFKENCKQVFISEGCTACLDNPEIKFTRNFDFCPYNKNYECTRLITPQMVIKEGDKLC